LEGGNASSPRERAEGTFLFICTATVCTLTNTSEGSPLKKLNNISEGLADMVRLLGAQELPPRLLLSPEVNLPRATPGATVTGGEHGGHEA
jgi:hypothetical protein